MYQEINYEIMRRVLKFRTWDGEKMISPDFVDRDGVAWWRENSIPERSEIVMQFTGLLSGKGEEIYEGDILRMPGNYNYTRVVEWYKIGLRVKQINGGGNFPLHYPFVGQTGNETDWEIIGNIYENPELLLEGNPEKGK